MPLLTPVRPMRSSRLQKVRRIPLLKTRRGEATTTIQHSSSANDQGRTMIASPLACGSGGTQPWAERSDGFKH